MRERGGAGAGTARTRRAGAKTGDDSGARGGLVRRRNAVRVRAVVVRRENVAVRARERGARARRAGAEAGGSSRVRRGGRASRERVAVVAVRAALRTSCVAQYCAYAQAATRS